MFDRETSAAERRSAAGVDVALGVLMAALAAAALFWLIPAQVSTKATGTDVSPAFIPQLAASVVLALSVGMVAHRLLRTEPRRGWRAAARLFGETAGLAAAAIAVAFSLSFVGFLPSAAAVIVAGGLLARHRQWWALLLLAVVFPLLVDYGAWTIFVVDLP